MNLNEQETNGAFVYNTDIVREVESFNRNYLDSLRVLVSHQLGGSTSCSSPEKQKEFDESSGTISVLEWCIGTGEDKEPQWYHNKIFPDIKRKDAFEYATELNNKYKTYMRKLGVE